MQFNNEAAVSHAFELTKLALEHGYIRKAHTSVEAAENTYDYYDTLFQSFTKSKDQDDQ